MDPGLSIIVPAYNAQAYLSRCLSSLLAQDLDPGDYEVIVVDDGSVDCTLELARSFAVGHTNIIVHSQDNQGPSAARNAGIRLAAGKYIWFVDSDDHVASRVLAGLVALMDREQLQVLAIGFASTGGDGDPRWRRAFLRAITAAEVSPGLEYMARHHHPDAVWAYIFCREFLLTSGVRLEVGKLLEDTVFTANVISAANRMALVPIDVYRHVQRRGSLMRTNSASHTLRLVAGYEGVAFGLEELRQRLLANGPVSVALMERLVTKQQAYVFFMIARLIRSGVPLSPTLPEALERLRAIDGYPLTHFPGHDYKGLKYKLLTTIFNREYLLYPVGRIVRLLYLLPRLRS